MYYMYNVLSSRKQFAFALVKNDLCKRPPMTPLFIYKVKYCIMDMTTALKEMFCIVGGSIQKGQSCVTDVCCQFEKTVEQTIAAWWFGTL